MDQGRDCLIISVSPADLPEGMDPQFRIRTLIGFAVQLDSSDKLTLDRETAEEIIVLYLFHCIRRTFLMSYNSG